MSMVEVTGPQEVVEVVSQTQVVEVNPVTGAVTVINAGPVGPPGSPGSGGGNQGYNHTQGTVNTTWTINHNLGYRPSVQTFTVGGIETIGEVQHISNNQVVVTFVTAIAGFARLV